MQQQQPTTGTFIGGNIFDHPGSSQPVPFPRQSSTGSEHGFVIPTTQFVSCLLDLIAICVEKQFKDQSNISSKGNRGIGREVDREQRRPERLVHQQSYLIQVLH